MPRLLLGGLTALLLVVGLAACGGSSGSGTATLNWWIATEPGGSRVIAAKRCNEQADGRYRVVLKTLPNNPDDQRTQLVRRLAAGDSSIDLIGMDVVWTAEFAEANWILPFPKDVAARIADGRLDGPLRTATYDSRLYGAPSDSNSQLLWYRKSLVDGAPPKTWDALIKRASALKQKGRIEIAGAAAENTTVWFNSLVQSAGGTILDGPRDPDLGPAAVKAVDIMGRLATSKAADPSISQQKEDQNRLAFETGQAAFQVNWPFIYPSAQENAPKLVDDIGWAGYPAVSEGKPAKAPIGGFNQGVSSTTKHPQEAFAAAECLASAQNQVTYATKGGLPPTLGAVYDRPAVRKQYPFGDLIRRQLDDGAPRPVTPAYSDISLAIYSTLSPPQKAARASVIQTLRDNLKKALDSKALL